ncbi:interferon regulatory factor 9 isoform X2 [Ambystoma mexicanum]|uniref:interferon regulatory factor 9 isoform X2 n=1 Tax=Ambystoma mexicanum TaxID=8296 RepID=UPI0037E967DB
MAVGFVRSTRKLKQWMIDQVDSDKYPGLVWDDTNHTSFRIPWKHGGKQDFRQDEDAAIFKAWAIYKGKYKEGQKVEAAMWKTRLRCALNKSPEFAEVPERSQLDISEPYKVYRLVPPEEQNEKVVSSSRKRKMKEEVRDLSSEDEMTSNITGKIRVSVLVPVNEPVEEDCGPRCCNSVYPEDSGVGSSSDSPERSTSSPQGSLDNVQMNLDSPQKSPDSLQDVPLYLIAEEVVDMSPVLEAGIYSMRVTIFYGGQQVLQEIVQSGDCKIAPSPLEGRSIHSTLPINGMERLYLPATCTIEDPVKRQNTQDLLSFLEKGIMLASTPQGIFLQRFCQARVFWTSPYSPQPGVCNKLEKDNHVKVFDTIQFLNDLHRYQRFQGAVPRYQVILCFGEEISDTDQKEDKLVTVQVEQMLAIQLLTQDLSDTSNNTLTPIKDPAPEHFLV